MENNGISDICEDKQECNNKKDCLAEEHCTKKTDFKTREKNLMTEIEGMLKHYYDRPPIKTYLSGEIIHNEAKIILADE